MRRYISLLIIIAWSVNLASAPGYTINDIEWGTAVSGTLNKGDTVTNGAFMVKAVQFPSPVQGIKDINGNLIPETDVDPMVFLEIYKNGVLIKEIIMNQQSEAYTDPDYEVKIWATAFPAKNAKEWIFEYYKPWASISIQTWANPPKLDITVTTDKSVYTSYDDQILTATVTVANSGESRAKNIDVYLDIGELKLRGGDSSQLHKYYYKLEKGESQSFEVILLVPELLDQKSYNMSANGKGFDFIDRQYNTAKVSTTITVSPKQNFFVISKGVRDRMYLQNTANVRVTVGNGGMYNVYNINVTDKMNEHFELKSNTSLQWNIPMLKPGEEWGATYSIKPLEASLSGFIIPAANAQFTVNNKPYNASSNTVTVVVNGPKILLNKTVDKPVVNLSENVNVTVSFNNVGDIGTRIEVKDSLPDSVSMVSGSTYQLNWSDPNSPMGFSYIIRMNTEGVIQLPAAVANYTDIEYRGMTRSVLSSERPIITVVDPSKIKPTPTKNPNATGSVSPTQTTPQETTAPTETDESFSQKIIRALKKLIPQETEVTPSPTGTPEPTPTPITPGFEFVLAVVVLIFAAAIRRR